MSDITNAHEIIREELLDRVRNGYPDRDAIEAAFDFGGKAGAGDTLALYIAREVKSVAAEALSIRAARQELRFRLRVALADLTETLRALR